VEGIGVTPDGNLELTGYADAAKIVEVPGELGKRLAHLGLHLSDLNFADECLHAMTARGPSLANGADIVQQALWNAAVVATYKCFGGNGARSRLIVADIFGEDRQTLDYYWNLRRKNVVHDENDLAQAYVLAVLEHPGIGPKIREVLCGVMDFTHADVENAAVLRWVVETTRDWVWKEIETLRSSIAAELNSWTYEALDALLPMRGRKPILDTIRVTRTTPGR
jgi:hypothetical protein